MTRIEKLIECLQIATRYDGEIDAQHDVIYFSGPDPESGENPDDIKRLGELGAHFASDCDSWAFFT